MCLLCLKLSVFLSLAADNLCMLHFFFVLMATFSFNFFKLMSLQADLLSLTVPKIIWISAQEPKSSWYSLYWSICTVMLHVWFSMFQQLIYFHFFCQIFIAPFVGLFSMLFYARYFYLLLLYSSSMPDIFFMVLQIFSFWLVLFDFSSYFHARTFSPFLRLPVFMLLPKIVSFLTWLRPPLNKS